MSQVFWVFFDFIGSAMAALDPWLHVSLKSLFGFPVPVHRGLFGFHGLH